MKGDGPYRILVADDNEINQRVLRGMLEHGGYAVHVVSNGEEALQALREDDFHLLIIDCLMPVLDGYETTRAIRTAERGAIDPDMPILAITALSAPGDREKCLECGMDDYISKPVDADRLYTGLRRLLIDSQTGGQPLNAPAGTGLPADLAASLSGRLTSELAAWRETVRNFPSTGSLQELRRLAHTIRGTADVFSEPSLSRAAEALERAAQCGDRPASCALTGDLLTELDAALNRL